MRALHVFPRFSSPQLAEQESYAQHLTEALEDLRVKVDLLHGDRASPAMLAKMWAAMAHCDVVLAGFLTAPMMSAVMRVAKARRKPVVLMPSLGAVDLPDGVPEGAAAALTVSEESARTLSRLSPESKVVDVGAGVDPAAFDDAAISGARFREKFALGERPFLYTPAGKGVGLAIEAMYFFVPGSLLLAVGGASTGGKLPSERVQFLGLLSDADRWDAYDACNVFVFPSTAALWGSAVLEAWARGKAVIGNPESAAVGSLIDDAVDGFLANNARTISKRVELLLEHPAQGRKMGEAGRQKLLAEHTWQRVAERVRNVYEAAGATCAIPQGRQ